MDCIKCGVELLCENCGHKAPQPEMGYLMYKLNLFEKLLKENNIKIPEHNEHTQDELVLRRKARND